MDEKERLIGDDYNESWVNHINMVQSNINELRSISKTYRDVFGTYTDYKPKWYTSPVLWAIILCATLFGLLMAISALTFNELTPFLFALFCFVFMAIVGNLIALVAAIVAIID